MYTTVAIPRYTSPARSRITTILLKVLIPHHLQVLHNHRRGPSTGSRGRPLADALGECRYRLWGRVADHDVNPNFVGTDNDPEHLLTRTIGCGLRVAPRASRVNP